MMNYNDYDVEIVPIHGRCSGKYVHDYSREARDSVETFVHYWIPTIAGALVGIGIPRLVTMILTSL